MNGEQSIGENPEDEQAYRIAYLIAGYIREDLTKAEHTELDDWVTASLENQRLFEEMTDEKNLNAWLKWKEGLPEKEVLMRLKKRLDFTRHRKEPLVRSVWPYAAAACILLVVFVLWRHQPAATKEENQAPLVAQDLGPGTDRATLTLADGKTIRLDSAENGHLLTMGNIRIDKQDRAQLNYEMINPALRAVKEADNILSTPSGGQFKIMLPDGTRVWLNSGSSLKYPVSFAGSKRSVILSGEAYFEVAKDPSSPFEVKANGSLVEVLGTHFNINAYTDELDLKITLAEGSVKVNHNTLIKPGEQALVNPSGSVRVVQADLQMELAWKNGLFLFKQTELDGLMRQVSRWYDCEVVFQTRVSEHFNASISRDVPASKLLHLLEETGTVHFRIGNKKITVMK
ncbi:MAG TPA: FecR domain-containing protein [Puia sp.]